LYEPVIATSRITPVMMNGNRSLGIGRVA